MISAVINAAKGINDNSKLKAEKIKLENEIKKINTLNKIVNTIEEPYERLMAQNQFLMAQTLDDSINRFQWEKVKKGMTQNIESLEKELKHLNATKLDVARIVTTLSQLSKEFDLELSSRDNKIEENINVFKHQHNHLEQLFNEVLQEIDKLQHAITNNDRIEEKIKSIETQKDYLQKTINNYIEVLNNTQKDVERLKNAQSNTDEIINKQELTLQTIKLNLEKIQESTQYKIDDIHSKIDDHTKYCQQMFNNQQNNLRMAVEKIDNQMEKQNQSIQQLKKLTFKITIPLYVALAGIIAVLFLV